MAPQKPDPHTLEFLLAFDGRSHVLEYGEWLKFRVREVPVTVNRPHGLRYSFTLHAQNGQRLLGFDNAHPIREMLGSDAGGAVPYDHWHRSPSDPGRPYDFVSVEKLLMDFFAEVERVLRERGVSDRVVEERSDRRREP